MTTSLKYKYATIKDMNQDGDYNFYGVIYDATFPVFDEKDNMYNTTVKVIDSEINCMTLPETLNDHLAYLIIKSTDKESLPFIHSVGDIIRVHRGHMKYKKRKNIYLNLTNISKIKSSWCIFAGSSDIGSKNHNPVACSSATYTLESQDKSKIEHLRSWIKLYLSHKSSLSYGKESKLRDRNTSTPGDNDVLVQVVYKTELDDKIVFFVQDDSDGCELHAFKYFNFVDVNDVIRVRSFKFFDKNVLIMNKFSNILKIPSFSDYYKDLINKISLKLKDIEPNSDVPMFSTENKIDTMVIDYPKTFGVILIDEEKKYQRKSLNEVSNKDEKFVLNLNILEIYPQTIYDFVSVMCTKCNQSYPTKEVEEMIDSKFNCSGCKENQKGKLYYNITLICRENSYSNILVKVYLSSYDDQGSTFFGFPPQDLYRNSTEYQKIKTTVEKLTKVDCYVEALVESIPTGFNENDRVYRIIGDYKNILA